MKRPKKILIRAHLFEWWTPGVAEVVDNYGSNIAWYHTKPEEGILTLFARFGDCSTAKQLTLLEIERSRIDVVAVLMRKMADEVRGDAIS